LKRLTLEKLIEEQLSDSRQGLNKQFTLAETPLISLGPARVANPLLSKTGEAYDAQARKLFESSKHPAF
jgi:hypothetical protein